MAEASVSPTVGNDPRRVRVEKAWETRDWALAARELADWQDDPEAAPPPEPFMARWRSLKQTESRRLLGRIDAARQARDLEGVLEDRRALEPLVEPDEAARLTRDLASWALRTFQERLRGGLFSSETAMLAARLAEEFAETPEGASLRASLPTLRRAAKLCPSCAGPYDGVEDRCPRCVLQEVGEATANESVPPLPAAPSSPAPAPATLNGRTPPNGLVSGRFPDDDDLPPIARDPADDPFFLDPDADADSGSGPDDRG